MKVENIQRNIDFARKKSKAQDEYVKRKKQSLEALASQILHASVIKF
jgi:hypothetical protein